MIRSVDESGEVLNLVNYFVLGLFWWVFDWLDVEKKLKYYLGCVMIKFKGWEVKDGSVVLIDEIDKGESDVLNGLLEIFGVWRF